MLSALILLSFVNCASKEVEAQHLFYLHGRIIELQGIQAVSPQFGPYEYEKIIDSLSTITSYIHAEVRKDTVDFYDFCTHISAEIDQLISDGVDPQSITVLGASKGAVMAMQISHDNPNPINYVLLAANNDNIEQTNDWSLNGRILGIYETSDQLAGKNYDYWLARSEQTLAFEQIELNTGLGHGFIYQPLPEWLEPLKKWME